MNAVYFFLGSDQVPLRYSAHPAKESISKLEIDSFVGWTLYLRGTWSDPRKKYRAFMFEISTFQNAQTF